MALVDQPLTYVAVTPLAEPGAYDFRGLEVRLSPAFVIEIPGRGLFVHVNRLKETNT